MTRRRRDRLGLTLPAVFLVIAGLGYGLELLPGPMPGPLADAPAPATDTVDRRAFDGLFRDGLDYLRQGRVHEAAVVLEAARRLRPHQPEVHVNLGFARLARGQSAAARLSFETAIDLRPRQINAYFGLAEALEQENDLEGALGAMRAYVHLAPGESPFARRAAAAIWEWEARLTDAAPETGK